MIILAMLMSVVGIMLISLCACREYRGFRLVVCKAIGGMLLVLSLVVIGLQIEHNKIKNCQLSQTEDCQKEQKWK